MPSWSQGIEPGCGLGFVPGFLGHDMASNRSAEIASIALLCLSGLQESWAQDLSSWCEFLNSDLRDYIGFELSALELERSDNYPWLAGERFWFSWDLPSSAPRPPDYIELKINGESVDKTEFPGTVEHTFQTFGSSTIFVSLLWSDMTRVSATLTDIGCEQTGLGGPFQINVGLNDAWYDPSVPGQGVLVTVYPSVEQLFLAMFVFDSEMPSDATEAQLGDSGHRWLTAQGPYSGNRAELEVSNTSGGQFMDPTVQVDTSPYGTMELDFGSCLGATLKFDLPSAGLKGEWHLERLSLDRLALCESLRGDFEK